MHVRGARLLAVTLVGLGIVAYSAWSLEFFLPTGLSPLHVPVRELMRPGRPYGDLFRITEVVSGAAFLLSGPPLVRLAPVQWTARLSAAAVSTYGVLLLVDAAYPVNAGVELALNLSFVVGSGSLVLWWPPRWRSVAVYALATVLLTWLCLLVLSELGPGHFAGVVSRLQALSRAVILAIGAAYLFRDPGSRRRLPAARRAGGAPKLSVPDETLFPGSPIEGNGVRHGRQREADRG
jgi:hypothetical protein